MKTGGSYPALIGGVSQQEPHLRDPSQQGEQINMFSDPINGLARRHGSVMQAEAVAATLTAEELSSYTADTNNWTSFDFDAGGKSYTAFVRRKAQPSTAHPLPAVVVYNKTDNQFLNTVVNGADTGIASLASGGVSAITSVGRFVYLAGNTVPATGSSAAAWNTVANNRHAVVWVRTGDYARTYSVTITRNSGGPITASFTTPTAGYPGTLDTSGISFSAPDYQKQVNDAVNAYNSAVNAWIGSSAQAVTPTNIAAQLGLALNTAYGSTVCVQSYGTLFLLNAADVKSIDVSDGADGSYVWAVADTVEDVTHLSLKHYDGKIVKVQAKNSVSAFYMKATLKGAGNNSGSGQYGDVLWSEAAGVVSTITGGLSMGTVVGSNFYLGSTAAFLQGLSGITTPTFTPSAAGDTETAPMPFFVGRNISYLGTFQGRLLVGCNGAMMCSRTDDYLNFFSSTVLTTPASDPVELLPTGSDGDVFRNSVIYNEDLVIFGDLRQYRISGAVPLTPTSANMSVLSSFEGAAGAPPLAAGGLILYAKRGPQAANLHRMQPGLNDKSPESFPISSQLDGYIRGQAIEMRGVTGSPNILAVRGTGDRNSLYILAYVSGTDGSFKLGAWHRWTFNTALGPIIGVSVVDDGIIVFTLRGTPSGAVYYVADKVLLTSSLSTLPYLDSQRSYSTAAAGGSIPLSSGSSFAAAYAEPSVRRLVGDNLPDVAALIAQYPTETSYLKVGATQSASFTVTNPFLRTPMGQAILTGRLTITKLLLSFRNSTGFGWSIRVGNTTTTGEFNGRILGYSNNAVGIEPVSTGQKSIPIGKETRDYTLTVSARRWYPLTVTAIDWIGQLFNRIQRY